MTDPTDDLAPLLTPTSDVVPDTFRAALLANSSRTLRRRIAVRRGLLAFAAGVLFVGGGGVGWWLKPVPTPQVEVVYVPAPVEPPRVPPPSAEPDAVLSASELEVQAELADEPVEAARFYRRAGDQYLTANRDYREASRCYRLYLTAAPPAERVVEARDSWLLIDVKRSFRTLEKDHANVAP